MRPPSYRALATAAALSAAAAAPATAEILSADEYGFTLGISIETGLSPDAAFVALSRVEAWWDPDHTYSLNSANLSLEMTAGGCFCENWEGGSIMHATVAQIRGRRHMRWTGGLGPLQDLGVSQVHDWTVEPFGQGSRITYDTRVSGNPSDDLASLAPIVETVMAGQLARLAAYSAGFAAGPASAGAPAAEEPFFPTP